MRWPWQRTPAPVEMRSEAGGFADAVVQALLARAAGSSAVTTAEATGALEAAAGVYARAFTVADVTPATSSTAALSAPSLAMIGRELIRRGECVSAIDVTPAGVRLLPAASWSVHGTDPDPSSWWYRVDLFGPSGNRTVRRPAAGVVHVRYSVDPARPWQGIGPLGWAALTGRLAGAVEDALADEAGGTRGHLLAVPAGPDEDGDEDDTTDPNADLRRDLRNAAGQTLMVETTRGSWGEPGTPAPWGDWRPSRIGADPPGPLVDLRSGAVRAVLAACGIPPVLFDPGGDAAALREAWRVTLHGGIAPLAATVAVELAAKLEVPGLRIGFDRLFASDLQGRARAYRSMVGNNGPGIEAAPARRLAGLAEADE